MRLFKHVCEGRVQDAVLNWCSHARRLVIRVTPNRKLYLRVTPKNRVEVLWLVR